MFFKTTRAGLPMAIESEGMSATTTLFAPMIAPSPIVTPFRMIDHRVILAGNTDRNPILRQQYPEKLTFGWTKFRGAGQPRLRDLH
jgi:hypothetical protein